MRTYTKEERLQIAQAFRAAKQVLWDGRGQWQDGTDLFICFAIERSGHPSEQDACAIVHERLDGRPSLGTWLMAQGITDFTRRQLQAHRHAWLDQLIEEFDS